MGEIILHVGPHKTGSTYIQKYLYLNREVLSEHGWVYPEPIELDPTVDHYGHIKLGFDETQISYYLNHSQGKRIIFSSENLYTLENEQIGRLFKSIFDAGFKEIVVVFYARHPIERIYSMIKESIKEGWYYSIPEFLSIYLLKPFTRKEVNYTIFLDTIKKFSSKIVIVDYEHFSKTSLLLPLLELMGIPPDRFNLTNEIVNLGIKIEFAEILRWLNLKFANSGINPSGYKVFSIVRQVLLTNSKLKEKRTILQNALSQYKKSITVGSFISSSLESLLLNKYFNNFYKGAHESWDREVVIDYISEEWMLNKRLLKILDELYQNCREHASHIT